MWRRKYCFLGVYFCIIAVLELVGSITAILIMNNLFLDYIYIPASFALLSLYLSKQHEQGVQYLTIVCILAFFALQLYKALDEKGYERFNSVGSYIDGVFMICYSMWNLRFLIKQKNILGRLRLNPDFWFTITIFNLAFLDLVISVLSDSSYASGSDVVLYALFISRNLLKAILLYGYYKGIKLLR